MQFARFTRKPACALVIAILVLGAACQSNTPEPEVRPAPGAALLPSQVTATPRNEIPPAELEAVSAAHFQGLGYMEQFEYAKAVDSFRQVVKRAPGWIPGMVNLSIALLNDTGVKKEEAKKAGSNEAEAGNFDEALEILSGVIARDPNNAYAHYCRGVILEQQGQIKEAHEHFKRVTEIDPADPAAWYWAGNTLADPENPTRPSKAIAMEQVKYLTRALELDPYLTPAIYRLSFAYVMAGERSKQAALLKRWGELNPDRPGSTPGPGNPLEKRYGAMGRYAMVVDPFVKTTTPTGTPLIPPRFAAASALEIPLAAGEHWSRPEDFRDAAAVVGRIRARFGAAITAFDANGDGKLDLFLASSVAGEKGVRDCLLVNQADGRFADRTREFGLPVGRGSVGIAAADFDADGYIDLFLTSTQGNRLLRNREGKGFEDVSNVLKPAQAQAISLAARWLDLDQDGDLDLYVINYCSSEHSARAFTAAPPPPGIANSVFRNDGQPPPIPGSPPPTFAPLAVATEDVASRGGLSLAFSAWPDAKVLSGDAAAHTGIAALDVDNDRDIDLVLSADGKPPTLLLNERLGVFRAAQDSGLGDPVATSGILTIDFDSDGRSDLAAPQADGSLVALRNTTSRAAGGRPRIAFEPWPSNVARWRVAQVADLDLDGRMDLLGVAAAPARAGELSIPVWARNESSRHTRADLPVVLDQPGIEGALAVDLIGDPLPEFVAVRAGAPPVVALNQGNGRKYLALELGGHWHVQPKLMRTNAQAIGTRVLVEGNGVHSSYDHTTPESGLGQSVAPVVLGLGDHPRADLVHLLWPDGVLQCELNVAADQKLELTENNRKTGSCPVLFTWNGTRFECLGDFLGGGGMGYLVAPGVYGKPDRDESMFIEGSQLKSAAGMYRISVAEPMDEVVYLDHVVLDVVDRPPGVKVVLDERFAPDGERPTGALRAWTRSIEPVRATDLEGRDISNALRDFDRNTVDQFRRREGWIGYAETHGIVLDFGTRLSNLSSAAEILLCLAGWVEYPYSQTNYAASTAGVALKPPTIERKQPDGTWRLIEPHPGYPAGLPRMMSIPLTGKLGGASCVLRITTNMECYYDQAFLAIRDRAAESRLRLTTLPVAAARLSSKGYMREISPDGRQPLLYSYEHVDPAPLARMAGMLTRFGDVASLLQSDDDRYCVVGPGDEARIDFKAGGVPALEPGWSRCYVLRSYGYCKDADPFTAGSDSVEPLPWKGMPDFPFKPGVKQPNDQTRQTYVREYQTRPAGGN